MIDFLLFSTQFSYKINVNFHQQHVQIFREFHTNQHVTWTRTNQHARARAKKKKKSISRCVDVKKEEKKKTAPAYSRYIYKKSRNKEDEEKKKETRRSSYSIHPPKKRFEVATKLIEAKKEAPRRRRRSSRKHATAHKKRQRKRWSPTKFPRQGGMSRSMKIPSIPPPINHHPRERKRETENSKAEKHSKPGRTSAGSR